MARSMGGGGRSGGSSGGGRSMGGGGRSSSRSFSGSGRSHTSGSSGTRKVGGGNSFRGPNPGPIYNGYRRGPGMPPPPPPRRRYGGYYGGRPVASGCSSLVAMIILIIIILTSFSFAHVNSGSSGKKLNKDKYEGAVYDDLGYYLDESDPSMGGFIDSSNEKTLINGMKNFYSRTGVFPFLYIVEDTDGVNAQQFGEEAYETLFSDKSGKPVEGNLLILFVASEQGGDGDYYLIGGLNIGATIDDSAIDEICNQINSRWDEGDLGKIIGNGLDAASKNIMAKSNATKIAIVIIIALAVIIIVLILFKWWKARKAQLNKEQEDLEKVLSTPLESFGDPMSELTQKYDDNNN
ncbi:MAG: TPM domain-containing protein [Wujia sp.]